LAKSNSTIVTCALKSCSAPRYHVSTFCSFMSVILFLLSHT
jgi:hypothetical protein